MADYTPRFLSMEKEKEYQMMHIRMETTLKNQLLLIAQKEGRSLNSLLIQIAKAFVADYIAKNLQ